MSEKAFKTAVVVLGSIGYLAFVITVIVLKAVGLTRESWIIVLFPLWGSVLFGVILSIVMWSLMKAEGRK